MIGYPGNYGVVVGARGFYRAKVTVYGTARHSGSSTFAGENAIEKAASFVQELVASSLPQEEPDSSFPFGPKLTVTAVKGGNGYSMVPDHCEILVLIDSLHPLTKSRLPIF